MKTLIKDILLAVALTLCLLCGRWIGIRGEHDVWRLRLRTAAEVVVLDPSRGQQLLIYLYNKAEEEK